MSALFPSSLNSPEIDLSIMHRKNEEIESECNAESIFNEAISLNDNKWHWRTRLESERSDKRNVKYYINYVGSKAARENKKNSNNHYLKHLVKIGCPQHDLYRIFDDDLGFTVNPTICSHKSWKCPSIRDYSTECILLQTISMNDIGLEWKRGAFSLRPLHIEYIEDSNRLYINDIFMKRVANTNFNKIFRPGSYGNIPSLKKGSWKQGKVFYVFKDDKLEININNIIILIFELNSPSTIIKSDKNKYHTIDGWENVVGGVGFYSSKQNKNNIASVLVLRGSKDFPLECMQKSKIKIYSMRNNNNNNNGDRKLIIGEQTFHLKKNKINNNEYRGRRERDNNQRRRYLNDDTLETSRSRSRGNKINRNNMVSTSYQQQSTEYVQSMENNYYSPYYINNNNDDKLQSVVSSMRSKFEYDHNILTQQNQFLNGKINSLQKLNAQFIDLNSKLMTERNQLLHRIQSLQFLFDQQRQQINELKESQTVINTDNMSINMNRNGMNNNMNDMNHNMDNMNNMHNMSNIESMNDDINNTNINYVNNTAFNTNYNGFNAAFDNDSQSMFYSDNFNEFEDINNNEVELNSIWGSTDN